MTGKKKVVMPAALESWNDGARAAIMTIRDALAMVSDEAINREWLTRVLTILEKTL